MLKGFAITPVVNGRISIGEKTKRDDQVLPLKSDEFHITSNVQLNGDWVPHPVHEEVKKIARPSQSGKLRTIPIRLLFDTPENNFRAELTCFDKKSRPMCVGDGESARRRMPNGAVERVDCHSPEYCEFGKKNRCKPFARLIVGIEKEYQKDPLAGFMFRTTSFNSIRAISWRLGTTHACTGGKLAGLPCDLKLKCKSSRGSMGQPIYYVDIEPRGTLVEAVQEMNTLRASWEQAGLNRAELESAVIKGYQQSAFFESAEDADDLREEIGMGGLDVDLSSEGDKTERPAAEVRQLTAVPTAVTLPVEEPHVGAQNDGRNVTLAPEVPTEDPSGHPPEEEIAQTPEYKDVLEKISCMTDTSKAKLAEAYISNHAVLTKVQKEHALKTLRAKIKLLDEKSLKQAA
jgi:hypothetical protein